MIDIAHIKRVHLIGVGGAGVSALGRLFASRGIQLSGSDTRQLDPGSIPPCEFAVGHRAENVPQDADIVVYSAAVPESNPERVRAALLGIPAVDYPTALGMVTDAYDTIAISGTHGKSTTTALAGLLFIEAGLDPSVIVGATVPEWGGNYRGKSKQKDGDSFQSDLFIVEACEYKRHMLRLSPQTIVLTNIEHDHPDYYRDVDDVVHAFTDYVKKLSDEGLLIYNKDSVATRTVAAAGVAIKISYGIGAGADLYAHNIVQEGMLSKFSLVWKGNPIGDFHTVLPGIYNIYNILAATALLLAYGGHQEVIADVLEKFHGIGRRCEVVGHMAEGPEVISDYAHHPTALQGIVTAITERYRGQRILTVFQPHQRERTLRLWDDFVTVLGGIPRLILVEPYAVPGREEGMEECGERLVQEVITKHPNADIIYAHSVPDAEDLARRLAVDSDVILVVGAGEIDAVARHLVRAPDAAS